MALSEVRYRSEGPVVWREQWSEPQVTRHEDCYETDWKTSGKLWERAFATCETASDAALTALSLNINERWSREIRKSEEFGGAELEE